MAENEIQILLSLRDEMTSGLKKVEDQLTQTNKNVQKQTQATSQSFDKQMGSLLVLGQTANAVDNIFSSYQNLQLRLENASERVANATDRLRKAQYNLNKVTSDGTASAADLAEAEAEVTSASRSLTISQNNLARAHNQVIGTYITIGMQVTSLIANIPTLITAMQGLITTTTGLKISMASLGAAIAVVTAGFAEIIYFNSRISKQEQALADTTQAIRDNYNQRTIAMQNLADASWGYADAIKSVRDEELGLINKKGEAELQAEFDYKNAQIALLDKNISVEEYYNQLSIMKKAEKVMETERLEREALTAKTELLTAQKEKEIGLYKEAFDFQNLSYAEQLIYLQKDYSPKVEKIRNDLYLAEKARLDQLQKEWDDLIKLKTKYDNMSFSRQAIGNVITGGSNTSAGSASSILGTGNKMLSGLINWGTNKKNDFVMRPGQSPVSFSSSDTIVGTKGGIGTRVIITGNIYGVNADDISNAIMRKLKTKIAI